FQINGNLSATGDLTLNNHSTAFFQVDAGGHVNFGSTVAFNGVINAGNGISGLSPSTTDDIVISTGRLATTGTLHALGRDIANIKVIGSGGIGAFYIDGAKNFSSPGSQILASAGKIGVITADHINNAVIDASDSIGGLTATTSLPYGPVYTPAGKNPLNYA